MANFQITHPHAPVSFVPVDSFYKHPQNGMGNFGDCYGEPYIKVQNSGLDCPLCLPASRSMTRFSEPLTKVLYRTE